MTPFPTLEVTPGTGETINTLPPAGQQTMDSGLPVTIASDQSPIPVFQVDSRAAAQSLAASILNLAYTISLENGEGIVGFEVTGFSSGTIVSIESSTDEGTTYLPANGVNPVTGAVFTTISASTQFFVCTAGCTNVRLRVSTTGAGNLTVSSNASVSTGLVALSTPLPPGSNVVGNIGTVGSITGALPAGTALLGGLQIADETDPTRRASVLQFHAQDNQVLGGSYGLNTGGVAQLLNVAGNIDRQREVGIDNAPAVGISSGATSMAMQYKTSIALSISVGVQTVTPAVMSGTMGGVPWSIQQGSVLSIDTGASQEYVVATAVAATTFTAVFTKSHGTNIKIWGFSFNQGRDCAGENDGATGAGSEPAVGYEFNSGDPSGGSYDRERCLQGKGLATQTISSGGTTGSVSIVVGSATGLQPGMKVLLYASASFPSAGYYESVNIDWSYISGATTIPLASAIVGSHTYNVLAYDAFAALGPQLNGFTAMGMGIEEDAIFDPISGLYYIERAATADGMAAANLKSEAHVVYNGATWDRGRAAPGGLGVTAVSSDGAKTTYRFAQLAVAPYAAPTDFIQIGGSATKTVRIKKIKLSGGATAAGNMPVQLIRRSTSYTTLGSAALNAVTAGQHDTGDAGVTATVKYVSTANITSLGTPVGGPLGADRIQMPALGSGIGFTPLVFDFCRNQDKAIILRGATDFLWINLNGAAIPSGGVIDFEIELEEDSS
jgi:hypothetical protein